MIENGWNYSRNMSVRAWRAIQKGVKPLSHLRLADFRSERTSYYSENFRQQFSVKFAIFCARERFWLENEMHHIGSNFREVAFYDPMQFFSLAKANPEKIEILRKKMKEEKNDNYKIRKKITVCYYIEKDRQHYGYRKWVYGQKKGYWFYFEGEKRKRNCVHFWERV